VAGLFASVIPLVFEFCGYSIQLSDFREHSAVTAARPMKHPIRLFAVIAVTAGTLLSASASATSVRETVRRAIANSPSIDAAQANRRATNYELMQSISKPTRGSRRSTVRAASQRTSMTSHAFADKQR
jgi:hypothetical protein